MGNLLSVSIESAYLDWLAGEFGDILLDEIVDVTKDLLKIEQNCFLEVVYKSEKLARLIELGLELNGCCKRNR